MFEEITSFTLRMEPEHATKNPFLRSLPIDVECACGSLGQLPVEVINIPGSENLPQKAIHQIDEIAQAYQGECKERLLQALNNVGVRRHLFVMLLSVPPQKGGRPILRGWEVSEYVADRKVIPWRSEGELKIYTEALGLLRDQMRATGWLRYDQPKTIPAVIPAAHLDFRG